MLLLALFALPFALPLLAMQTAEDAGVPACCRAGGRHGCSMRMHRVSDAPGVRGPREACPYAPVGLVSVHVDRLGLTPVRVAGVAMVAQAAGVARAECMWRVARERSRHKRGPPVLPL